MEVSNYVSFLFHPPRNFLPPLKRARKKCAPREKAFPVEPFIFDCLLDLFKEVGEMVRLGESFYRDVRSTHQPPSHVLS